MHMHQVVRGSLLAVVFAATTPLRAAEVTVMSTVALTPTLDALAPKFEKSGADKLAITYDTVAQLRKRVEAGATADVMILSRSALDDLQKQGKVAPGSIVDLGKTYVAIGVRAGAPKPDISTVEKLKAAVLAAKSISYSDPAKGGSSGVYFAKLLEGMGIADQMRAKTILVPGAQSPDVVARGESELCVAQASEIAAVPGTELVGPLPGELYSAITFSAGIGAASPHEAAAKALIGLLSGPLGVSILKSKGMDPP
jgi:molybdate transport system substrate-binding protein